MSKGINKVILVGNIGQDPESRTFPDGGMVTNISVATSESWKDKQTGQMQDRTEWHRVVLRDRGAFRLGQIASQYLKKGSKVYIEGKLQTRKWTDNQGVEKYTTEIIAEQMQMLDSRSDGGQSASQSYQQPAKAAPMQSAPSNQSHQPQSAPPASSGFDDSFDDDIPF